MTKRPRDGRAGTPDLPSDGPPASPRRGKGPPVPDDLELWRHTARSVTPLRKAKARVPEVGAPQEPQAPPRPRTPSIKTPPPPPPQPNARKTSPTQQPKQAAPKSPPPLVPIERRKARRIARGIVEIDDRIDLHGLRQVDAERRLRAFLLAARAHGLRTVLVITGKGGERSPGARDDGIERSERGVLRRSVPLWLEQPDLRDCVVGIAPAHIRHGGSGAIYIHLRRARVR
jgi:DNA-nicking Smr family endonuclease